MVFFSIIFHFAYPVSAYNRRDREGTPSDKRSQVKYLGGLLGSKALFDALNITDLNFGILAAPEKLRSGLNDSRSGKVASDQLSEVVPVPYNHSLRRPSMSKY